MKKSVLFVCTGNTCRSVMAEAILRKRLDELGKKEIEAHSAGIRALNGLSPSEETIEVMKEEGVDVSGFRTKNITVDMIKKADLILAMEDAHKDEILALAPAARSKTYLLKEYGSSHAFNSRGHGIDDPIGKHVEEYRIIRDEIKREIERFVGKL
ncbi:MAG: low molecular weight protein arginine phosphatase [Candidatus Omnitrophica bacterium]|nr:low molecular weight protein arginine phosphatase [Candidatus Omnitrophota bacterium]